MNRKFEKLNAWATRTGARIQPFTNSADTSASLARPSSSLCPLFPSVQKRFGPFCGGAVLLRRPRCYGFTASSHTPPFLADHSIRSAYKSEDLTQFQNRTYKSSHQPLMQLLRQSQFQKQSQFLAGNVSEITERSTWVFIPSNWYRLVRLGALRGGELFASTSVLPIPAGRP
jgi:hypothetical protein